MNEIKAGIYIDMDSLIDTRYGILKSIDEDLLIRLNKTGYYRNRVVDEFDYISHSLFKLLYERRNKDTLKNSLISNAYNLIIIYAESYLSSVSGTRARRPYLTLNVYPYELSQREINTILRSLSMLIDIEYLEYSVVNFNPYVESLNTFASEYSYIIMYDGLNWINDRIIRMELNPGLINSVLAVPTILNYPVVLKSIDQYEKVFDSLERLAEKIIQLNFIDTDVFCFKHYGEI